MRGRLTAVQDSRREAWLVGLLAFGVRLAHASFVADTPFFEGPVIDSQTYWKLAEHIASGQGFGGPFYQPPLYPTFLAAFFGVGLTDPWWIVLTQAAAGSLTAVLLCSLAETVVGRGTVHARRVGLATGVVAALYGPLVLFDVELLPPALVHLAMVGGLVVGFHGRGRPGWRDAVSGLLFGLATTGWAMSVLLAPGAWALRRIWLTRRRDAAVSAALMVSAMAVPIGTVAATNAASGAPGVVISWNAGINLWLGNNPDWRQTWRARPGAEFEPELEQPDRRGVTEPAERSRWFVRRVLQDVAERPGAALSRTAEKLYYVWHGREIRRNQDLETLRDASPVLAALQWEFGLKFPFGLLVPLALLGAWHRRHQLPTRVLLVSALVYSVVLSLFFVAARYRLPMVLLLLPLAVDWTIRTLLNRRIGRGELVALVLLTAAFNWPNQFTASFGADAAEKQILRARSWRAQGKLDRAAEISRRLVRHHPDHANAQMLRAEILIARGDCKSALDPLKRVAERAPDASTPWVRLGNCLRRIGNRHAAEKAYARALSIHPHHPQAIKGAALVYMHTGRRHAAITMLRRFRRNGYEDPGVTFDLGRLLLETDQRHEALDVLEPLLETRPNDDELRRLVERARQREPSD